MKLRLEDSKQKSISSTQNISSQTVTSQSQTQDNFQPLLSPMALHMLQPQDNLSPNIAQNITDSITVSSSSAAAKSCNTCGGVFSDATAYRNHFRYFCEIFHNLYSIKL